MQHIYRIKSSQNWVCPKSGAWKVICVGGGASGGFTFTPNSAPIQQAGGTTSFGNLLAASGGQALPVATYPEETLNYGTSDRIYVSCGGFGGWDGINYAGSPANSLRYNGGAWTEPIVSPPNGNGGLLGCAGIGYGAGGGFSASIDDHDIGYYINAEHSTYQLAKPRGVPGLCGEMVNGIFDLTASQSVACTVGTSTKPNITHTMIVNNIKQRGFSICDLTDNSNSSIEKLLNAITTGTSGIIYLEYLG